MSDAEKDTARPPITVRVEADKALRFYVGTRWKVVASSLDSLWEGDYSIKLEEIKAEGDEE